MRPEAGTGQSHESTLREMAVRVDGLERLLLAQLQSIEKMLDERDKLYTERDNSRRTAVEAALKAAEVLTNAAFAASEKAIVKAEESQKSYNQTHNDLARKMDDQNKATMPRPETETRFRAMEEKYAALRDAVGSGAGILIGGKAVKDESRANLALGVSAVGMLILLARSFLGR